MQAEWLCQKMAAGIKRFMKEGETCQATKQQLSTEQQQPMVAGWPILVDRLYRYCGSTHTNALKKHCILVQSNNFTRCISYSKHNGWYNSWTAGKAGVLLPERARTDSHWPGDTVWIKTHDWTTIPYHLKANRVIEGENCCFKDCCVRCWEDMTKRTGICCCYRQCKHSELFSTNSWHPRLPTFMLGSEVRLLKHLLYGPSN